MIFVHRSFEYLGKKSCKGNCYLESFKEIWARKMAQEGKSTCSKPDDLSSISGTYMVEEEKRLKLSSDPPRCPPLNIIKRLKFAYHIVI